MQFRIALLIVAISPWVVSHECANAAPRPLTLKDVADWKDIQQPTISNDGLWFACQLTPVEGNSEIVIRQTHGKTEYRFSIGDASKSGGVPLVFSNDSKWVALPDNVSHEEAKELAKSDKPIHRKALVVNLESGDKTVFEKVDSLAFSGDEATWIAIHKAPAKDDGDKDKARGPDLLLYELATGRRLNVGNVSQFAFNKSGQWLAMVIDAADDADNGVHLRNMVSGAVWPLDGGKAEYKKLSWTEEGNALAVLKSVEHEDFETPLVSLIGCSNVAAKIGAKTAYDPRDDDAFPTGMTISTARAPQWTDDRSGISFGIHKLKKKTKAPTDSKSGDKGDDPKKKTPKGEKFTKDKKPADEKPDVVVWHYLDKRLPSQQQVEEGSDKTFSYLCIYRVPEKKFLRLADDDVKHCDLAPGHRWAVGRDNTKYELAGNLRGRRYEDIYIVDARSGKRRLAVPKCRWYFGVSPEGDRFLFYRDGHFWTYEMSTASEYQITKDAPTTFVNVEDDHNVVKPPVAPIGWAKGGASVLLYDSWDVWNVPAHGGRAINLTGNGRKKGIRYGHRFRVDPDEKGIDLSLPVYLGAYGEFTKKSGISRIDVGGSEMKTLQWEDAHFSSLSKAENADVYLFRKGTFRDFPEYYVANERLESPRKMTLTNPQQKKFRWSPGGRLVDYRSSNGDRLQAALYLPADFKEGQTYPTIVYIYEKVSLWLHHYSRPRYGGFKTSLYTSQGYAVLMPDIKFRINDPGVSSVGCVLPALRAAIATGVIDKDRVALHGHSWGGYQTAFLITQTDAFKAAIAGAPLTNLVSMYSSIYWNTGSANQPIFESGQGRFTGNYVEIMEAFTRNSPVLFADKVKTPLLLLHNDKDGAVDWNQGIEYFNTLRHLGKPVVMLQYKGENHGLAKPANRRDYSQRMLEFFDHYLKGKPAPKWLSEGIPHLDLEEHLKSRAEK